MTRTELRAKILKGIAHHYENVPDEYIPVEYQIGVSLEKGDVMVIGSFDELPEGYEYVVLVDLYESTVSDAVEYVFRQIR